MKRTTGETLACKNSPAMDVRLVAAIVFVLLVAAGALGVLISQRILRPEGTVSNVPPVQGAAFGILALLLAFSFSVGLARYDARRTIIVSEANAITTLWYRSALLAPAETATLRGELRGYLSARLTFLETADDLSRGTAAAQTSALEQRMWRTVLRGIDVHTSSANLVITAVNDVIAISAQQAELQRASIPETVLATVVFAALMAVFLLGTGFGRSYRHATVAIGGIALVIAVVFTAIIDLDRPLDGSIRLNVQPLRQAQSEIALQPPAKPRAYAGTASRISGNAILSS